MMFAHIHSTKEKLYGLFNLHVQLDFTIGAKKMHMHFRIFILHAILYDVNAPMVSKDSTCSLFVIFLLLYREKG